MTSQWIGFWVVAVCLLFGMLAFTAAVIGANRFGFAMNRLHSAGIGDTLGVMCIVGGVLGATGFHADTLKLILIIVFMWFTSPVSSHFLTQIEYYTNPELYRIVGKGAITSEKQRKQMKQKNRSRK